MYFQYLYMPNRRSITKTRCVKDISIRAVRAVALIRDLCYSNRNVGVKTYFTANIAPLRPARLKGAVRTSGFNSLEWPLYGVLSILILLTVAIALPLDHPLCTRTRPTPS